MALNEQSGKKLVAYSTLSQIGIGIMVYGLGFLHAGYVNLISHGLAKSILFMVVGYAIHSSWNSQDIRLRRRSSKRSVLIRFAIFVRCASLIGTTFISGILRKEGITEIFLNSNIYLPILGGVILRVYLTFFYCMIAIRVGGSCNIRVVTMNGLS